MVHQKHNSVHVLILLYTHRQQKRIMKSQFQWRVLWIVELCHAGLRRAWCCLCWVVTGRRTGGKVCPKSQHASSSAACNQYSWIITTSRNIFFIIIQYKPTKWTFYKYISSLLRTRLLILIHVEHTTPYLYIQPSSWRRTLGFETCRRHYKLKIKILI